MYRKPKASVNEVNRVEKPKGTNPKEEGGIL